MDDCPAWDDAVWAATLFAIDPHGLGGIALRAPAGLVRDQWALALKDMLPPTAPWRRLPAHIADDRLLGGLDLAATLQAGRPVAQRGLLAESHDGVVLIPMAERLPASTAARLASALDLGELGFERHGISRRWPSRIGVVAFDEGCDDDPALPEALTDRLAFFCDIRAVTWRECEAAPATACDVLAARQCLPAVTLDDSTGYALVAAAQRMGVVSVRASLMAARAARAAAALHGRTDVTEDDARLAARLVLAPRATLAEPAPGDEPQPHPQPVSGLEPESESEEEPEDTQPPAPDPPAASQSAAVDESPNEVPDPQDSTQALEDRIVSATQAALPANLLAALPSRDASSSSAGRVGALSASLRRGRPVGSRAGQPRGGARLNLVETLRAAAPWQRLRAAEAAASAAAHAAQASSAAATSAADLLRVHVRAADLRVSRLQQRAATATLFVIDASGSSALHRLAEAKGAINLLLAECYVRRDQVGVIAFRGRAAEVLLPPTRSLVRAKRSLAGLPGGGGTPLASGLEAAMRMASQVRRAGVSPIIVLLTDGRANVALDGGSGRARAETDAAQMARRLRAARLTTLLVDTSPQASAAAQRLAADMAAHYRALPYAGAAELSAAVQSLARDRA